MSGEVTSLNKVVRTLCKKSSSLLLVAPVLCALNAGGKLLGFVVVVFLLENEIKSEFCFQRT